MATFTLAGDTSAAFASVNDSAKIDKNSVKVTLNSKSRRQQKQIPPPNSLLKADSTHRRPSNKQNQKSRPSHGNLRNTSPVRPSGPTIPFTPGECVSALEWTRLRNTNGGSYPELPPEPGLCLPYRPQPANPEPAQPTSGNRAAAAEPAPPPPPPVITLTDLQELVVEPAQIIADKDGFGLKNGNTNFYSSTYKVQTSTQNMLGYRVDIEAEPVEWDWDYGDGTTLTTDKPGYPQKQFNEETDTSHVYTDTGEFTVTMTTHYTGKYRIDGGEWITIPGRLSLTAEPMTADIWRAKTRNVYEDCNQNPNGWGCNQNR